MIKSVLHRSAVLLVIWIVSSFFACILLEREIMSLSRGVERPTQYTDARIKGEALYVFFQAARVVGYSHPFGLAGTSIGSAWARIETGGLKWRPLDRVDMSQPYGWDWDARPFQYSSDITSYGKATADGTKISIEPVPFADLSSCRAITVECINVGQLQRMNAMKQAPGIGWTCAPCMVPYDDDGDFLLILVRDGVPEAARIAPPYRHYIRWWWYPLRPFFYPGELIFGVIFRFGYREG